MEETMFEILAVVASAAVTHLFVRQYRIWARARRIQQVTARLLEG